MTCSASANKDKYYDKHCFPAFEDQLDGGRLSELLHQLGAEENRHGELSLWTRGQPLEQHHLQGLIVVVAVIPNHNFDVVVVVVIFVNLIVNHVTISCS